MVLMDQCSCPLLNTLWHRIGLLSGFDDGRAPHGQETEFSHGNTSIERFPLRGMP